jgi:hypothetical protein
MKKIAIFTEGQSGLIFVRKLLLTIIDNSVLSFQCLKLFSDREHEVPYTYPNPNSNVHFLIVNAGNDSKVLSAIKDREERLINKGYEKIIGLRDMYSAEYHKLSPKVINDRVLRQFIERASGIIQTMTHPDKIVICFSIMELEAWFLSMYTIFRKIKPALSVEYIDRQLGINLRTIDPQKQFYKPSVQLEKVLDLCGIRYDKTEHDVEMITSKIESGDFEVAIENGRFEKLKMFYDLLGSYNLSDYQDSIQ